MPCLGSSLTTNDPLVSETWSNWPLNRAIRLLIFDKYALLHNLIYAPRQTRSIWANFGTLNINHMLQFMTTKLTLLRTILRGHFSHNGVSFGLLTVHYFTVGQIETILHFGRRPSWRATFPIYTDITRSATGTFRLKSG